MGWEVIVAAVILGGALIVTVKTWAKAKRADRELKCPHSWGMWETYKHGPLKEGGRRIGQYAEQERSCTMCGEIRYREEQHYG